MGHAPAWRAANLPPEISSSSGPTVFLVLQPMLGALPLCTALWVFLFLTQAPSGTKSSAFESPSSSEPLWRRSKPCGSRVTGLCSPLSCNSILGIVIRYRNTVCVNAHRLGVPHDASVRPAFWSQASKQRRTHNHLHCHRTVGGNIKCRKPRPRVVCKGSPGRWPGVTRQA